MLTKRTTILSKSSKKYKISPEKVLEEKLINEELHYLIKWQGYPSAFNTWVLASNLDQNSKKKSFNLSPKKIKEKNSVETSSCLQGLGKRSLGSRGGSKSRKKVKERKGKGEELRKVGIEKWTEMSFRRPAKVERPFDMVGVYRELIWPRKRLKLPVLKKMMTKTTAVENDEEDRDILESEGFFGTGRRILKKKSEEMKMKIDEVFDHCSQKPVVKGPITRSASRDLASIKEDQSQLKLTHRSGKGSLVVTNPYKRVYSQKLTLNNLTTLDEEVISLESKESRFTKKLKRVSKRKLSGSVVKKKGKKAKKKRNRVFYSPKTRNRSEDQTRRRKIKSEKNSPAYKDYFNLDLC
jgi:hypothetical protein